MAGQPSGAAINTQDITDKARRDLLRLLETVLGKKNLVIDRSLAGAIGLFVKFSTLQEYGVDKLFFLENHNVDSSQKNVVFLARGEDAKTVRTVAEQIRMVRSESRIGHEFTVIWVPRRTLVSNLILEEHGVLGEANITQFDLHFVPLEQDLLSLELEDAFGDLALRKDPTPIFASAKALMLLQKQYGLFPRILGKGDNAKRLVDLLQRMRSEEDADGISGPSDIDLDAFSLTTSSVVEHLIVIDREVDMPTALATQLTYEGLLDEVFGVTHNQTEVDAVVLDGVRPSQAQNGSVPTSTTPTKRKVMLDNSDRMFPSLRDANFATIGPILNQTARKLMSDQENIRSFKDSVAELRKVVNTALPTYQAEHMSVKIHTSLAEEVMKFTRSERFRRMLEVEQNLLAGSDVSAVQEAIDELIFRDAPLSMVLRLLCLASALSNGLRQRDLDQFKRHVEQAYGFEHILTLANLEKMGLLVPRDTHRGYLNPIAGAAGQTATDWTALRRSLALWLDDVQEAEPTDIAYVFSGYAPMSVRLVQAVLQKAHLHTLAAPSRVPGGGALTTGSANSSGSGWTGFTDVLSRIRGATVDVTQKGHGSEASHARKTLRGVKEGPKTTIVFYLGGITFAEVAALRYVSKQLEESSGRKLVIAATGVIGGKRVMDVAIEKRKLPS